MNITNNTMNNTNSNNYTKETMFINNKLMHSISKLI